MDRCSNAVVSGRVAGVALAHLQQLLVLLLDLHQLLLKLPDVALLHRNVALQIVVEPVDLVELGLALVP